MAKNASDRALATAQEFLDDLNIQSISDSVTQEYPGLDFTTLHESTNDELEAYITMYGGYRSYLEVELADSVAIKTAFESHFNELYNIYIYQVAEQRETDGKKKLTREEIRGAAMTNNDQLRELRTKIMGQEAIVTRVGGLLAAYKACYDAVSRVVTVRNLG